LKRARETRIDLARADFLDEGQAQSRYFVQLAGAGLDARAIELVSWKLKKNAGPLAYVVAGLQALAEKQPRLTVRADGKILAGELALLGNGKFYGGPYEIFPGANLSNGLLDACVFPRVNVPAFFGHAPGFLLRRKFAEEKVRRLRAAKIELSSETPAAFELDGEWVGNLPATFSVEPQKLRVVVP
jgi:diacylglycerol kinase family enzyme